MVFCVRQEVIIPSSGNLEEDDWLEKLITGLGEMACPVELALPHKMDDYHLIEPCLDEMADRINGQGARCVAAHAPQGRLGDDTFEVWGEKTVRFAEEVGAHIVVFHPHRVPQASRPGEQPQVVRQLRRLQRDTGLTVTVEAFGSRRVVLSPEEICQMGIPLTLDTSHLFHERSLQIIGQHARNIAHVHLSEARDGGVHLPIRQAGLEILEHLRRYGWHGAVCLEYLWEYRDEALQDCRLLQEREDMRESLTRVDI
jgi:sugar phosphate isomerase/epimerase